MSSIKKIISKTNSLPQKTEAELLLNYSRLQSVMEAGNIAWWEMDCTTGKVLFHENKARILGHEPENFSHYNDFTMLIHAEDYERVMQAMRDHISGKLARYDTEYRIRTRTGEYLWFRDLGGISERDESGMPKKISGIVIDITEWKLAEEALVKNRKEFQSYFDSSSVGLSVTAPDKTWIEVNQRLCELFGYTKEELTGITWVELSHPDDLSKNLVLFQQVMDGKSDQYELDKRFIRKDGSIVYVIVSAVCQRNDDGTVHHFLTSYIDITDRVLAEKTLRQTESRLNDAQQLARVGSFNYDALTDQSWWSEELFRLYGLEPQDKPLTRAEANAFSHPDDRNAGNEMIKGALETGGSVENIYRIIRNDGSVRYHHAISRVSFDQQNKLIAIDGTVQDITERRLVEEALEQEELRIRAITHSIQDAILMMNPNGNISFINPATEKMFGYKGDELIGKNLHILLAPRRYQTDYENAIAEFFMTGKGNALGKTLELGAIQKNGQEISIELSLSALKFQDGWYGVGIIRDISARKKAEEELKESQQLFKNLAQVSPVGIFRTKADGYTTYVNPRWSELSGITPEEALGYGWLKAVHPEDRDRLGTNWNNDVNFQHSSSAVYRFLRPDGSIVWVLGNAVPEIEDNIISGFIGTITDITERKQAEEEISKLNEGLEQRINDRTAQLIAANKEMEAFSYSVSHDLRSPLRALDGFAHILLEDYSPVLDVEGKRLLNVIAANANKMGDLIDDLLAFSRVNRHEMRFEKIDMYAMAKSVYQEIATESDKQKTEFLLHNIHDSYGDPAMLRQVWINLIGNALND